MSDTEKGGFTFAPAPKPAGYWVLYPGNSHQTRFTMYHRPTDEQIKNTQELLGWGWREEGEKL